MGLDMYLERRSYVKNWDYMTPPERHEITVKRGGEVRDDIKPERISYIIEQVAYWRKANHIHKWFVDHVQDGQDDCGEYGVSIEQLAELVNTCKTVLSSVETVEGYVGQGTTYHADGRVEHHTKRGQVVAQQELADKLLPTQPGFFFGSTDYDEYYLDECRSTIEMLEPLLADTESSYYYSSSW